MAKKYDTKAVQEFMGLDMRKCTNGRDHVFIKGTTACCNCGASWIIELQAKVEELEEAIRTHKRKAVGKNLTETYKADDELWAMVKHEQGAEG